MKTVTIETPALYGDHHVVEVRRILLELAGVSDVYASSAFHIVEVTFDPEKITAEAIETKLGEFGYLDQLQMATETGQPAHLIANRADVFFRHTEVFETTREVVSFAQRVNYNGKPLWYCPGMGVVNNKMEE